MGGFFMTVSRSFLIIHDNNDDDNKNNETKYENKSGIIERFLRNTVFTCKWPKRHMF